MNNIPLLGRNKHIPFFIILLIIWLPSLGQNNGVSDSLLSDQKISFSYQQTSLTEIFSDLSEQYNLSFFYVDEQVDPYSQVSADVEDQALDRAMDTLLYNTSLTWFFLDENIIISKKELEEVLEVDSNKNVQTELSPVPEDTNKYTKVFLSSFSESRSEIMGKVVYKIYLRKKERYWTLNPDFSNRYIIDSTVVFTNDSLRADTLSSGEVVKVEQKKRIRLKPKPENDKTIFDPHWAISFSVSPGRTRWDYSLNDGISESEFDNRNKYKTFSKNYSLQADVSWMPFKLVFLNLGLSLRDILKEGVFTNYYQNRFYPSNEIHLDESYSYRYLYFGIPVSVGFRLPLKKVSATFSAGIEPLFFLSSNQDYLPEFQVQYFSNLDPNSTRNPGSSYYYDENYNRISPQETDFNKVNYSIFFQPEVLFKMTKRSYLGIGLDWFFFTNPIFEKDTIVNERPNGSRLNFRYSLYF